jgi:hypothetical protein
MLALALWRDRRCKRCGGDLAETTDEHNDGGGLDRARYRPLPPVRCHLCTALAASEDAAAKNRHPHALIHRAELLPAPRPRSS